MRSSPQGRNASLDSQPFLTNPGDELGGGGRGGALAHPPQCTPVDFAHAPTVVTVLARGKGWTVSSLRNIEESQLSPHLSTFFLPESKN